MLPPINEPLRFSKASMFTTHPKLTAIAATLAMLLPAAGAQAATSRTRHQARQTIEASSQRHYSQQRADQSTRRHRHYHSTW